jgi:hypothetical protein
MERNENAATQIGRRSAVRNGRTGRPRPASSTTMRRLPTAHFQDPRPRCRVRRDLRGLESDRRRIYVRRPCLAAGIITYIFLSAVIPCYGPGLHSVRHGPHPIGTFSDRPDPARAHAPKEQAVGVPGPHVRAGRRVAHPSYSELSRSPSSSGREAISCSMACDSYLASDPRWVDENADRQPDRSTTARSQRARSSPSCRRFSRFASCTRG